MIIIIDEASAKLASFYYHDEIFKLQWKRAVEMTSASQELYDELQELERELGITLSNSPTVRVGYEVV